MILPVLEKDDTWRENILKLNEECSEAVDNMDIKLNLPDKLGQSINIDELIALETLDVIQVCIGILDKLKDSGTDLEVICDEHNKKLMDRGWNFKGQVEIRGIGNVKLAEKDGKEAED